MTNVIRLSPEGSGRNHRVAVDGAHLVPSGIDECQLQDPQGRTGLLAHASPHSPIPGLRGPVDYRRSRFGGVALRDAPASDGPDQAVIFRLTADPVHSRRAKVRPAKAAAIAGPSTHDLPASHSVPERMSPHLVP